MLNYSQKLVYPHRRTTIYRIQLTPGELQTLLDAAAWTDDAGPELEALLPKLYNELDVLTGMGVDFESGEVVR